MAYLRARLWAASGLLMLGGCATDGYYGGIDAGYGYGGGYGNYGPAAYGYGGLGGWYDDVYYPGSGYYVFDRAGNRRRWNDNQRGYWERRRAERPNGNAADVRPGTGRPANGQWQGNRPGNGRPRSNDQPNSVPMSKADRRSVREFGATIEQRRAADAASSGRPYVSGGGYNGPVQAGGNRGDGNGGGRQGRGGNRERRPR